jgi:AcrR family transcriptional regulator
MSISRITEFRQVLRERQRHAYRDAILDNSERLFRQRGVEIVKVRDIAEATGISVGTLYNYFRDKNDLVKTIERRCVQRFFESLQQPMATEEPLRQLEEFLRRTLLWLEQSYETVASVSSVQNEPTAPSAFFLTTALDSNDLQKYNQLLDEHINHTIQLKLLGSSVSSEKLSWYLRLLMQAAFVDWIQTGRVTPLSTRGSLLLHLFLDGAVTTPDIPTAPDVALAASI